MRERSNAFGEYLQQQYDYWYQEGRYGHEYNGTTWVGYYGWCHGKEVSHVTTEAM